MAFLTDEIGIRQAKKYGLEREYLEARKYGLGILQSLEEWDLLDAEFLHLYDGYLNPAPTFRERVLRGWHCVKNFFLSKIR